MDICQTFASRFACPNVCFTVFGRCFTVVCLLHGFWTLLHGGVFASRFCMTLVEKRFKKGLKIHIFSPRYKNSELLFFLRLVNGHLPNVCFTVACLLHGFVIHSTTDHPEFQLSKTVLENCNFIFSKRFFSKQNSFNNLQQPV